MGGPSSPCGTMGSWCCSEPRWRRRITPGGRCGRRWGCSSVYGGVHVDAAWPLDEACVVCQGLHTGRMLLGSLGDDGRLTYTAVGDTTQHATWLAQQAAPGTILVSDATARLVHGEVRLEACASSPTSGRPIRAPPTRCSGSVPTVPPC